MRLPIVARGARRAAGVAALLAALLGAFAPSLPAQAGAGLCRTNPVVVLTNGTVIDLGADIGTGLLNLNHVTYTLHVPRGIAGAGRGPHAQPADDHRVLQRSRRTRRRASIRPTPW